MAWIIDYVDPKIVFVANYFVPRISMSTCNKIPFIFELGTLWDKWQNSIVLTTDNPYYAQLKYLLRGMNGKTYRYYTISLKINCSKIITCKWQEQTIAKAKVVRRRPRNEFYQHLRKY